MKNKRLLSILLAGMLVAGIGTNTVYATVDTKANEEVVKMEKLVPATVKKEEVKEDKKEDVKKEDKEVKETADKDAEKNKGVVLDSTFFPDENFRKVITQVTGVKENEVLTQEKLDSVKEINASNKGIKSVKGSSFFRKLETFNLANNQLTEMDMLDHILLKHLDLSNNQLTSIDLEDGRWLYTLNLNNNKITKITNLSQASELQELYVKNNKLPSLVIDNNTLLEKLDLSNNQIVTLDLNKNKQLKEVDLSNNQLTAISFAQSPALKVLKANNNKLTNVDLSRNEELVNLSLENNKLSKLDLSKNINLKEIKLNNQTITSNVTDKIKNENGKTKLNLKDIVDVKGKNGSIIKGYEVEGHIVTGDVVEFNGEVPNSIKITANLGENNKADFNATLVGEKTQIALNETYFPDVNFRRILAEQMGKQEGDNLTQADLDAVTQIYQYGQNIGNIQGIEYFKNLETLILMKNKLSNVDLSKNTKLISVNLSNNDIQNIDLSKNTELTSLTLSNNHLKEVDLSKNDKLMNISLSDNELVTLNLDKNVNLENIYATNNKIANIDLSKNVKLQSLDLSKNNLSQINLSTLKELRNLYIEDNALSTINLTANVNLGDISLQRNNLESIDLSKNVNLKTVQLSSNKLDSIDVSANTKLTSLSLDENKISNLDMTKNPALTHLTMHRQQIRVDITDLVSYKDNGYSLDLRKIFDIKAKDDKGATVSYVRKFTEENYRVAQNGHIGFNHKIPTDINVRVYTPAYVEAMGSFTARLIYNDPNAQENIILNSKYFPDSNFRKVISKATGVSEGSVIPKQKLDELEVINAVEENIVSIRGIEHFKNLQEVILSGNKIESVDLSKNVKLRSLALDNNKLKSISLTDNPELHTLQISANKLTSLDLHANQELLNLDASNNDLTRIDLKYNTKLNELYLNETGLEKLDVTNNKALTDLYVNNNKLTTLDLSRNPNLQDLDLLNNSLTEIDLSANPNLLEVALMNNKIGKVVLPKGFKGAINVDSQELTASAKDKVVIENGNYLLDLNKVFSIVNATKTGELSVKSFKAEGYEVSDKGVINFGNDKTKIPSKLAITVTLTNDVKANLSLTIEGDAGTPLLPITPAKPIIKPTPITPAKPIIKPTPITPAKPIIKPTPITPAKPIIKPTPITPAKPIKPNTSVDWTELQPAKPINPNKPNTEVKPNNEVKPNMENKKPNVAQTSDNANGLLEAVLATLSAMGLGVITLLKRRKKD